MQDAVNRAGEPKTLAGENVVAWECEREERGCFEDIVQSWKLGCPGKPSEERRAWSRKVLNASLCEDDNTVRCGSSNAKVPTRPLSLNFETSEFDVGVIV